MYPIDEFIARGYVKATVCVGQFRMVCIKFMCLLFAASDMQLHYAHFLFFVLKA